ncbi:hypothetical protein [Endozoicomonas acroporae]|uniref:hypothetical protein n=1 Tax=Endozoicomonas acroporae TaxID=1701104 RepID=UPI0013CF963E|nr:hypothetical protein [Endozoicomonas acroporae]
MVPFRYRFSIAAVFFLLLNQSVHALTGKEDMDCHHPQMGLNSIRSAFQKWEYGRKHPNIYRERAPEAMIEHYRRWQEYPELPAHIRGERAALAMVSTFHRWNEARKGRCCQ